MPVVYRQWKYKKAGNKISKERNIDDIKIECEKIFEAVISSISNKILTAILKNAPCTTKIKSNIH